MSVHALYPSTAELARVGDLLLIVQQDAQGRAAPPQVKRIERIQPISRESIALLRFTLAGGQELDFIPIQPIIFAMY